MMALYIAHEAKSPEDSERKLEEEILDILSFVGISQFKDRVVADLPLGHQRATQIAIALGTKPHLLLLDEPLSGMNPRESGEMVEIFRRIRESGVTILWIEHEMSLIMGSCDKITVLDFGYKLAEGSPQEIRNNQAVIEAYLGKGK